MIVELSANGSTEKVVLARGAFLSVLVAVANPGADAVVLGTTVAPWWTKVTVLDGRGRQMYWPFERLSHYPADPVLSLGEGGNAQLELGLSPEDFDLEDSGSYALRVAVEAGSGRVESNEVEVLLLDEEMSEAEARAPEHLAALAAFLTKRGRHVDARAIIDELLASGSADLAGLLLLGELQEDLGDREGAVRTYEHAERLFWEQNPNSYEGPEIVVGRIVRLRRAAGTL